MVRIDFDFGTNVTIEQRIGFEMAAAIWSQYLTDDVVINLQVGCVDGLNGNTATGGAVPILHKQHYGVFREYYEQDITHANGDETASADEQANTSLQTGNTVDLLVNGELLDGNTEILLTSAQAKALGMTKALALGDGSIWDRDLVNEDAMDGYIVVNSSFDWNYDFTRSGEATEGSLDFLSMALHEIGHNLGFISGLDGTIDVEQLYSGKTQISDFTALDLFRHTIDSAALENPDGSVSSLAIGENAYFSIDGGQTNIADFSSGQGGDGFQASHWKRMQNAMGIMDPTLAYQERMSLSAIDLQAMDVLGWNVNYSQAGARLDLEALLLQAEASVASSLGVDGNFLSENRGENNLYTLGYSQWLQLFEDQIIDMGYSQWWQIFELGYDSWQQQNDDPNAFLDMGYSQWWQEFEAQMIDMGYSQWWQEFETQMLDIGYSQWWQVLEIGYSQWWQKLETYFSTLEETGDAAGDSNNAIDYGTADTAVVVSGGDDDDILAGSGFRDLVSGGGGDDLIDGKAGDDNLLGEAGQDILYGAAGNDRIYGGEGDDFIAGEYGNDRLYGEDGHDIISGGAGNDVIEGGAGKDLLTGNEGSDVIDGGTGDDDVDGGEGNDIVIGGQGNDIVSGGQGDDVLFGDRYVASVAESNTEETTVDLEAISEQAGFVNASDQPPIDFWVRLEAEDLKLTNFSKVNAAASGGGLVTTGGVGNAEAKFMGPTGIYDIIVGYHDESDGAGNIQAAVDGQAFDWTLNKELQHAGISDENFTTRTIRGVEIESGKLINIQGTSQGGEFMRIDYIDVISTTQGTAFAHADFYDGGLYLKNVEAAEAAELGGSIVQTQQGSKEAHWLSNTLGQTSNVARVDISHTQFNVVLDEATLSTKNTLRLEAESFELAGGYAVEARTGYASGGAAIAVNGSNGGSATATFTGKAGLYNVFVGYIDERGSSASAEFAVNGQNLDSWYFDAPEDKAGYRAVASQLYLDEGDTVQIQGWANNNDNAHIDYVDFVATEAAEAIVPIGEETILETEDMSFSGTYSNNDWGSASGGRYTTLDEANGSVLFTGDTGYYDVVVSYYDNNDYRSQLTFSVNEEQQDQWAANKTASNAFVERTVASSMHLTSSSDYLNLVSNTTYDSRAYTDYIKLVRVEDPTVVPESNSSESIENMTIIEAESIWYSGTGSIEDASSASGGEYAQLYEASGSTLFQGETGYYDVIVSYYDNNSSTAQITFNINEEQQDQWLPNQTGSDSFVERTVASNVKLTNAQDYLQLIGRSNGGASYIDYIKLVKVEEDTATTPVVTVDESDNSDILRGGQGNDIMYGGQGNDIMYGEDEFDNGLANASSSSDTMFGGDGDDTIYGNSGDDYLYGDSSASVMVAEILKFQQGLGGYSGTSDTYIVQNEDYRNAQYGSNSSVNVDERSGEDDEHGAAQGLLKFADIFGNQSGQISSDAVIQSAVIELDVYNSGSAFDVYEMFSDWHESSTWSSLGNGVQTDGMEAAITSIASTGFVGTGTLTIDVTESLRAWQSDPTKNQGWAFISTGGDGVDFYSSENGSYRPRLLVDVEQAKSSNAVGNDTLEGGRGNDTLEGGLGDDRLDGSDAIARGAFEQDILGGGLGSDTFVLGSQEGSYYSSDMGNDYARIKDFDASTDVLVLHGSADRYVQWAYEGNLRLHDGQDLIAVVENVSSIDFASNSVAFV